MKAILICPGERPAVAALSESMPLSNLPICGKALIEYWIEHLCARGAREIFVLATDRPEQVRALVANGARWGVTITVLPEFRELTPDEAINKYRTTEPGWLPENAVNAMDFLPGSALPLFNGYREFILALQNFLPHAAGPERIGLREIEPGVWMGLRARAGRGAKLIAPCWIGDDVSVGDDAVIGPMAVLENRCVVEHGVEVNCSVVQEDTFVGQRVSVIDSIAWGSTLINWRLNSSIHVPDSFLICSLVESSGRVGAFEFLSRVAAFCAMLLTLPLALFPMLRSVLRGVPTFRAVRAVCPKSGGAPGLPGEVFVYYELTGIGGWLKRWPQLWSVIRGDLAWIGNRPLTPDEAALLVNEFERLWLSVGPGLLSLADTEQTSGAMDDAARAHASFYAVRANWWLDVSIFFRALFLFVFGISFSRAMEWLGRGLPFPRWHERKDSFTWRFKRKTGC